MNFIEQLHQKPLLTDGAMGTMIYEQGVSYEQNFEQLNLTQPKLIANIHAQYARAGADVIETNTFGGNRFRLAGWGLDGQVAELNGRAVEIARAAAKAINPNVFIAASIGPTGLKMEPLGSLSLREAHAAFKEQITALAHAGADVLLLETFSDLSEIEQAIRAAKEVCTLPIVAHMTFSRDGRTLFGNTPDQVATRLRELGADVIGANCSTGPRGVLDVVTAMQVAELKTDVDTPHKENVAQVSTDGSQLLSALPNAGFPEQNGARLFYPATPDYFGNYAMRFAAAGVRLIGGCCGTTPDHTRAMRKALDNQQEATPKQFEVRDAFARNPSEETQKSNSSDLHQTNLKTALQSGTFVLTVEVEPPKGVNTHELEDTARMLRDSGATVLDVSDMPMARMKMSALAAAHRVQLGANIETVLHFPVRGRNLLRVQGDLLAAHALNLRNLFVTMGDPASIGDFPQASDNHDIVPTGLVQLVKEKFNCGTDSSGASIGNACSFVVGCAANLTPQDFDKEAKLLKKKIDCGADFALTQPVFDVDTARAFLKHYESMFGKLNLPILMGVLPLASVRHAEFLRNEVPGMMLPDVIVQRLDAAGSKTRTEGARIASEIALQLRDLVQGIYIIPAFGRYDIAGRILRELA